LHFAVHDKAKYLLVVSFETDFLTSTNCPIIPPFLNVNNYSSFRLLKLKKGTSPEGEALASPAI
jgi:hypothetical protein